MSFLRDKDDVLLAEGDYADIRVKITKCDELGRTVHVRMGGGNLALGSGLANPSPDTGVTFQVKPGDLKKV